MATTRGIGDFNRQLASFEKKVVSKLIRTALRDGAKAMSIPVKADAPVDSGQVKRSVRVRAGKRSKKSVSALVKVTGGHDQPIIGFVVLGTKDQAGDNWIQRDAEAHGDSIRANILDAIAAAVAREKPAR